MSNSAESTCKGCGRPIVWGLNITTGKRVPLDPSPLVYEVFHGKDDATECVRAEPEEGVTLMTSHFNTCPKANDFSKGGSR